MRIAQRTHYIQLVLVSSIQSSAVYGHMTSFRVYVVPLFGAYVADTYWGRFKTISVAVGIALFGHILLIISAVPGVIEHPDGALACFIVALVIMGIGTGAFKANISPLIAEQYNKTKLFIRYTKSGEKVIVDPSLTISSIYMVSVRHSNSGESIDLRPQYFYLFINIGALVGQIGMTYSEKVGSLVPDSEARVPLLWF